MTSFGLQVSWCKFEVAVDCPKDVSVLTASSSLEVPPVVVAAVNLKTIINEKHNVHEIVSASVICCHRVKVRCSFSVGKKNYFTSIWFTGLHDLVLLW